MCQLSALTANLLANDDDPLSAFHPFLLIKSVCDFSIPRLRSSAPAHQAHMQGVSVLALDAERPAQNYRILKTRIRSPSIAVAFGGLDGKRGKPQICRPVGAQYSERSALTNASHLIKFDTTE